MIHKRTRSAGHEFIHKGFTRRDTFLVETRHPVHAVWQPLAMPMHAGVLWQAIGHINTYPIALNHLDGRAR